MLFVLSNVCRIITVVAIISELIYVTDYRRDRRDEDGGRYAGVRRETLLNGVSFTSSFICAVLRWPAE